MKYVLVFIYCIICIYHFCLLNARSNCVEMFCPKFWDISFSLALQYLEVFATAFMCLHLFSFDQEEADRSCGIKVLQTNIYFAEISVILA